MYYFILVYLKNPFVPLIRSAKSISLAIIVTRLAWSAARLVSSNSEIMNDSEASWRAERAED